MSEGPKRAKVEHDIAKALGGVDPEYVSHRHCCPVLRDALEAIANFGFCECGEDACAECGMYAVARAALGETEPKP